MTYQVILTTPNGATLYVVTARQPLTARGGRYILSTHHWRAHTFKTRAAADRAVDNLRNIHYGTPAVVAI